MGVQETLCECGQRSGTNSDCTSCRFVDTERKISAELVAAKAEIDRLKSVLNDTDNYAATMDALASPADWDVPGIIADVANRLKQEGDGKAAAVIDTLSFRMRDIAQRISHGHAKRIDANTVQEAAEIAATFA
jgi:hypothetical protein